MSTVRIIIILIILTIISCLFLVQDTMTRTLFQTKQSLEIQDAVQDLDPRLIPHEPLSWLHNIFFVETSCVLMNISSKSSSTETSSAPAGGLRMPPRVACSLEAAARLHPQRPVYYVHTCPVDADAMWRTAPEYARRVLALANVRVWVAHFADLVRGTPVERLLTQGQFTRSAWPIVHASDALRVLLLSQYGGTYLDTDVLMLRSLGDMKNFAALEEPNSINNAVMDFALDDTGQQITQECLKGLHNNYKPRKWAYNGPQLISRVMRRRCGTVRITSVTPKRCKGFQILPVSSFYPVHYTAWEKYYREEGAEHVMKAINDSYGVHMWHKHSTSKNITIYLGSKQPYAQLARRVCPSVVESVGATF